MPVLQLVCFADFCLCSPTGYYTDTMGIDDYELVKPSKRKPKGGLRHKWSAVAKLTHGNSEERAECKVCGLVRFTLRQYGKFTITYKNRDTGSITTHRPACVVRSQGDLFSTARFEEDAVAKVKKEVIKIFKVENERLVPRQLPKKSEFPQDKVRYATNAGGFDAVPQFARSSDVALGFDPESDFFASEYAYEVFALTTKPFKFTYMGECSDHKAENIVENYKRLIGADVGSVIVMQRLDEIYTIVFRYDGRVWSKEHSQKRYKNPHRALR